MSGHDLGPIPHADVRPRSELVDEIARHALLEALAAAEDGHALRMVGEEHGRLPRRVAGAHDVDVEAVRGRSIAACRAVGNPFSGESVEPLDSYAPPRDTAREDDRPG